MGRNDIYTGEEVIAICRSYMNDTKVAFVEKALAVATKAHEGQERLSGEPYINHPIQVAGILANIKLDPDTVATGFLHDVVEDTDYTLEKIREEFSESVAFLVDGVTKLGKIKFQSKEEQLAENHRKMLIAMAKDIRVVMVKLADRLHNMRTLKFQKPQKQIEKSQEALDIYAPLAERIGMSVIKWELEDISLRYINPQAYYDIVHQMDQKRDEREAYIQVVIDQIKDAIEELSMESTVYGRPKHIYSIYRKMVDQNKDFDDIYDLLAVRVLVDSIKDCYGVLGIIHTKWKPMPGRFKDYIAMPKANMYQSIHTTVIGPQGKPVEVQIRTHLMHEVAEYGLAAHWAYKEGKTVDEQPRDNIQQQLKWFHDIVEYEDDAGNASEFMEFIKEDVFKDQVYIFTPKGDVFELPLGSGPVDFAFHIHTEIGNKTVGAKVNGNIVPLNYRLKNGDIVEILTNPSSVGPSRDWLKFVKTSKARNRIKRYFKMQEREKNSEIGQELLEKALKENDTSLKAELKKNKEKDLLERFNFNNIEDLYASVGLGEISPTSILHFWNIKKIDKVEKLTNIISKDRENEAHKNKSGNENGVVVDGVDNLMIRLSRCCNPVPGDEIVGYITRGRGISVHRKDCTNLLSEIEIADRTIAVHWAENDQDQHEYETEIQIIGFDRSGMINDVLHVVNHTVKNLKGVNGRIDDQSQAIINLKVLVANTQQLQDLIVKLKNIPDVYEVERQVN
ncbi:RelA/SpoT family protein [Facklamia miroungae]|uniref:GTP diphosphokinase n=1 Tax=Facklamia miroungae TaxID=120956 RepID=A0A1G7R140_9LACT|nr:bifunctional (p)ppGpp synthetase/guanosine-3',5'-bis(diphosphate) 3'-pyrophosphohydrolase [Facklamia miroungae]NKZ29120.1 bifunctional (p)ppGpp synthetase/guanosine-3',5'-bis(diphosphate) 3'-pyrophosphohydrolase [Facklamia miroungae]SDG03849.1 GTP pyrophosphokinase [Facklamia miroungae]